MSEPAIQPEEQQSQSVEPAACAVATELHSNEAVAAAAQIGCTRVNRDLVNELMSIGVDVQSRGLLQAAAGALIVSMQAGIEMLQECSGIVKDPKTKPRMKITAAIAGAALIKSIHGSAQSIKADGIAAAPAPQKAQRIKRILQMPSA